MKLDLIKTTYCFLGFFKNEIDLHKEDKIMKVISFFLFALLYCRCSKLDGKLQNVHRLRASREPVRFRLNLKLAGRGRQGSRRKRMRIGSWRRGKKINEEVVQLRRR